MNSYRKDVSSKNIKHSQSNTPDEKLTKISFKDNDSKNIYYPLTSKIMILSKDGIQVIQPYSTIKTIINSYIHPKSLKPTKESLK